MANYSTLQKHMAYISNALFEKQKKGTVISVKAQPRPSADDLEILKTFTPERDLMSFLLIYMASAGLLVPDVPGERFLVVTPDCDFMFVGEEEANRIKGESEVPEGTTFH